MAFAAERLHGAWCMGIHPGVTAAGTLGDRHPGVRPKLLGARITTWPLTWALSLASADLRVYMPLPAKTSLMVADHGQGRTMVLVATKDATIAACSQVSE
jgi:hypothetical protein